MLERDREKLAVRSEYFSRCYSEFARVGEHGESLFLLLKSIKQDVFKSKDLSKDTVKVSFNNIDVDLLGFEFVFFSNSRFISGPTIPEAHIKPSKRLIVITTFFSSFFIFVISAFVLHWWQSNKKAIMSTFSL